MEMEQIGHLVAPLLADALIEGQDDAHVMAQGSQGLGQAAGHIGQSAGLDEGGYLRRSKENIHKGGTLLSHSTVHIHFKRVVKMNEKRCISSITEGSG